MKNFQITVPSRGNNQWSHPPHNVAVPTWGPPRFISTERFHFAPSSFPPLSSFSSIESSVLFLHMVIFSSVFYFSESGNWWHHANTHPRQQTQYFLSSFLSSTDTGYVPKAYLMFVIQISGSEWPSLDSTSASVISTNGNDVWAISHGATQKVKGTGCYEI